MNKQLLRTCKKGAFSAVLFSGAFLPTTFGQVNFELVDVPEYAGQEISVLPAVSGTKDFVDVDGDGDLDLFVTGYSVHSQRESLLFTNDGTGVFTLDYSSVFVGVRNSEVAFFDVDSDGDKDLLLVGEKSNSENVSLVYLNDGSGKFTELQDAGLPGVEDASLDVGDVDGDNDLDLLLNGKEVDGTVVSALFLNDGGGVFSEDVSTPLELVVGQAKFIDLEGDSDLDVVFAGSVSTQGQVKAYENDGTGTFVPVDLLGPQPTYSSITLKVADFNGDTYSDLLLVGQSTTTNQIYLNDGKGDFQNAEKLPYANFRDGIVEVADLDDDGDLDVVANRREGVGDYPTHVFVNDGAGVFSEVLDAGFEGGNKASFALGDVDGDGLCDAVQGTYVFENAGGATFKKVTDSPFQGMRSTAVAFADVDGDKDVDVLVAGTDPYGIKRSKLYLSDGVGGYELAGQGFEGVYGGAVAFADIDGDNDLDLFLNGRKNSGGYFSRFYLNDGAGNFTPDATNTIISPIYSAVAFSDLDADGDVDFLITGILSGGKVAELYFNDGTGVFTASSQNLDSYGVSNFGVRVEFADADGDGSPDLFMTGQKSDLKHGVYLLKNDGKGRFDEVALVGGPRSSSGALSATGDVDGDGDLDWVISHGSKIYVHRQDEDGVFIKDNSTAISRSYTSLLQVVDVDHDGDLDLVVSGDKGEVYENDGTGIFSKVSFSLPAVNEGSLAVSDVGADGDFDLLISGKDTSSQVITHLYRNVTVNTGVKSIQGGFSANGLYASYQWVDCSNGNSPISGETKQVFFPKQEGTYAVEVSYNGNTGTSECLEILFPKTKVMQDGETLVVEDNGPEAIYQWIDCGTGEQVAGATSLSYTPSEEGNYSVIVEAYGQKDTSECMSYAKPLSTAFGELSVFQVSPNPTTGEVMIDLGELRTAVELSVVSLSGQILERKSYSSVQEISFVLDAPRGVYFLHVNEQGNSLGVLRIVKK